MSTARRTRRSPFEFGNDCAYDRGSLHRDREERGPDPRAEAPRCRLASAARYFQAVGQMAKVLALRENPARRQGPGKLHVRLSTGNGLAGTWDPSPPASLEPSRTVVPRTRGDEPLVRPPPAGTLRHIRVIAGRARAPVLGLRGVPVAIGLRAVPIAIGRITSGGRIAVRRRA